MVTLGNKTLCSGCFSPVKKEPCKKCGFSEESYTPDNVALPCGSVLMGSFLIGGVIGKGGFGITYRAYDVKYGRVIAIKEYFPIELAVREQGGTALAVRDRKSAEMFRHGAEKFYNEASFVAKFSGNPNIVKVYQFFYENNTAYFTMEYLDGMTLKDYVTRCGCVNPGQAVNIADKIAYALCEAHRSSVLHRDVSPDNIMLCRDGNVKLLDFGAARQVFPEGSQLLSVILKPGFAPLEQYMRNGKQGEWTDVYSLAASVFYGLTGQIPEDPQSRFEEDSRMDSGLSGIQPDLRNVICYGMKIRYAERYQTTEEFRAALANVPIRRQEVRLPRVIPEATEAEKQNPVKKLLARLFGG
ncbi:MAG: serine/threonine protein kinase [Ruminococcus sp.]|nr:serine/threonine protein kinase [Ruminococcus sp.]MCM1380443.1 serine/threonine protein kinase [Muribaculaceae bacterium]MCM1478413.1 serine/threonine protein kinase [Muribaculaceae bacterium]